MTDYEEFCENMDQGRGKKIDIQFYLDGIAEEHGEIFGVLKRARRGDYDDILDAMHYQAYPSNHMKEYGIKETLKTFPKVREDFIKEVGDHHWYMTRLLQRLGFSWEEIETENMEKLKKRIKKKNLVGKGSNR